MGRPNYGSRLVNGVWHNLSHPLSFYRAPVKRKRTASGHRHSYLRIPNGRGGWIERCAICGVRR